MRKSLSTRLRLLEEAIDPEGSCLICGYPKTSCGVVIVASADEQVVFGQCDGCGRRLHCDGRPMPDHALKRIIIPGYEPPKPIGE